jgi:sulfur carrier protein
VITVNGNAHEIATPATVAVVLDALGVEQRRGVAVAVDAEVVPRSQWESYEVADRARLEIVTAVQGG